MHCKYSSAERREPTPVKIKAIEGREGKKEIIDGQISSMVQYLPIFGLLTYDFELFQNL